jgi:hypothetical protein
MFPGVRQILRALLLLCGALLISARAEEPTKTPTPAQEPEPLPAPTAKPIEPMPPPSARPAEINAPGTIAPIEFLTPGGLRSPTDVVAPTKPTAPIERERGGLNFESVNLHPGFAYDLTYTDNSRRTTTSKKQDALEEFGPNLTLNARPAEQVNIDAAYAFLEHDYIRNTARDYLSHSAFCTIAMKDLPVDHLNLALGDTYLQTGNTSVLETEILSFTRFQTNKAFGYADYTYDNFKVHTRYDFDNLNYFGAVTDQDVRSESGTFDASYRLSEVFELFSTYSIIRTFQQTSSPLDPASQDRHTAETGFVATFDHFSFSAAGGYTWSQIIYDGPQDDGAVASASVNYRATSRLEAGAYAAVGLSQNAREGRVIGQSRGLVIEGEGREPFSYGGYASYRAFEHIRLTANVGRTNSTGIRSGQSKDFLFGGSAQLLLNERARIEGTVFRDLHEGVNLPSTTLNSYSANFSYQLTRRATALFSFTRTDQFDNNAHTTLSVDEARFGFRFTW